MPSVPGPAATYRRAVDTMVARATSAAAGRPAPAGPAPAAAARAALADLVAAAGCSCCPAPASPPSPGSRTTAGRQRRPPGVADDLPDLHRRPGRPPPLLGAQPPRLAADRAGRGPTAGTGRSPRCRAPACSTGIDHAERGRPAPGRRRPRRDRPARPAGPGASASTAARSGRDELHAPAGRGQRELARGRGGQPRRRRRPARRRAGRLPHRWTATAAAACSSRTWCSSARPCRPTGSGAASRWSRGRQRCSCWAPR